jgi:hypothetical protein
MPLLKSSLKFWSFVTLYTVYIELIYHACNWLIKKKKLKIKQNISDMFFQNLLSSSLWCAGIIF